MITANILRRTFFIRAAQYGTAFIVEVEGEEFLVRPSTRWALL